MDDVSSETCFVFIKKYRKNELQKHRVVHQSDKYVYVFFFVLFCFGFFFVGLFFLSCFCFCCGEKVWIRLDHLAEEWFPTRVQLSSIRIPFCKVT